MRQQLQQAQAAAASAGAASDTEASRLRELLATREAEASDWRRQTQEAKAAAAQREAEAADAARQQAAGADHAPAADVKKHEQQMARAAEAHAAEVQRLQEAVDAERRGRAAADVKAAAAEHAAATASQHAQARGTAGGRKEGAAGSPASAVHLMSPGWALQRLMAQVKLARVAPKLLFFCDQWCTLRCHHALPSFCSLPIRTMAICKLQGRAASRHLHSLPLHMRLAEALAAAVAAYLVLFLLPWQWLLGSDAEVRVFYKQISACSSACSSSCTCIAMTPRNVSAVDHSGNSALHLLTLCSSKPTSHTDHPPTMSRMPTCWSCGDRWMGCGPACRRLMTKWAPPTVSSAPTRCALELATSNQ